MCVCERKKRDKEGEWEKGKEIEKGGNVLYLSLEFNIIKVDNLISKKNIKKGSGVRHGLEQE